MTKVTSMPLLIEWQSHVLSAQLADSASLTAFALGRLHFATSNHCIFKSRSSNLWPFLCYSNLNLRRLYLHLAQMLVTHWLRHWKHSDNLWRPIAAQAAAHRESFHWHCSKRWLIARTKFLLSRTFATIPNCWFAFYYIFVVPATRKHSSTVGWMEQQWKRAKKQIYFSWIRMCFATTACTAVPGNLNCRLFEVMKKCARCLLSDWKRKEKTSILFIFHEQVLMKPGKCLNVERNNAQDLLHSFGCRRVAFLHKLHCVPFAVSLWINRACGIPKTCPAILSMARVFLSRLNVGTLSFSQVVTNADGRKAPC